MPSQIEQLYEWTCATRASLLDFLANMSPDEFVSEDPRVPMGSFRNLVVHMANCYRYWLDSVGRQLDSSDVSVDDYPDVDSVRRLFNQVDDLVAGFVADFPGDRFEEFSVDDGPAVGGGRQMLSPLWLLSNAITHEFNHKGQILALARARGIVHEGRSDLATPPVGEDQTR